MLIIAEMSKIEIETSKTKAAQMETMKKFGTSLSILNADEFVQAKTSFTLGLEVQLLIQFQALGLHVITRCLGVTALIQKGLALLLDHGLDRA